MPDKKVLEIKNLKVAFRQKGNKLLNIIRGVDISLYEGQIVGIVGESGSGKSVTTKSLMNVNFGTKTACDSYQVFGEKFASYDKVD